MGLEELKKEWVSKVEAGAKVEIGWDAGGDETPVGICVDGQPVEDESCWALIDQVIEVLDLPNAGEYFVEGEGELLVKDGQLFIKHQSNHSGYDYDVPDDFNPETDDFEEYGVEVEKTVKETVVLIP